MTPDKLREKGNRWRELGQYDLADIYNQHAAALEEIERLREAVELLYDKWENGDDCHEVSGDEMGVFLGKAFQLSKEEEDAILALLKGIPTPSPMQIVTQRAEQAERRAERLKVHAEAMAEAIQFGDLAILTVAKVAAEAYRNGGDGPPLTPHGEAIAAGDGTLHGAIDYWQQQAFTMAAGQCCVESGCLMADDHGNTYCDMQRQRDELRGRLRVMANIMSDALDAIKAVEGDCSDEDEALMHLRAKMASAMDSVKRADMKAAT